MSKSDDIKAAQNATDIQKVFKTIKEANTDRFNDSLQPEDILRTLIVLSLELKRLSDAVAALQAKVGP